MKYCGYKVAMAPLIQSFNSLQFPQVSILRLQLRATEVISGGIWQQK